MGYVPKIAVVGGGVSGLVLAQELSSRGLHATVFDTGEHACGGRASTREVTDDRGRHFSFDHSTQYFTATPGSRFAAMAASWVDRGLITPWPRGRVGVLDAGAFAPFEDDVDRYVGVGGLRPLADALATGDDVDIVRPQWVGAMTPIGGDGSKRRWELASGPKGKRLGTFDFVAVAHNGKCAARLAGTARRPDGSGAAEKLTRSLQCAFGIRPRVDLDKQRKLILSSVWALMFFVDQPLDVPSGMEGAHVVGSDVVSWASNVTAKRRHGGGGVAGEDEGECWVVHSTPQFARDNKCPQENIPASVVAEVTAAMTAAFESAAGLPAGSVKPSYSRVQLWGAANPLTAAGIPAVFDSETRTGACGDWCEGPPCVEAAAESAASLADAVEALFRPTEAKHPNAAATLDAANARWSACVGAAAGIGAFPGTEGAVPAMAEVAAAPRREGGGRRGGARGRGGRGGRGAGRGEGRGASPRRGGGGRGAGRGGRGGRGAGAVVAAMAGGSAAAFRIV